MNQTQRITTLTLLLLFLLPASLGYVGTTWYYQGGYVRQNITTIDVNGLDVCLEDGTNCPAIAAGSGIQYINSPNGSLLIQQNTTHANITANITYFDTFFYLDTNPAGYISSYVETDPFYNRSWNQTKGDALYAPIGTTGDNTSWNKSYADTLYYSIANPSGYITDGNTGWDNLYNLIANGTNAYLNLLNVSGTVNATSYLTSGIVRISTTGLGTFAANTTINALNVCLSDGTNCPAGTGGDITDVVANDTTIITTNPTGPIVSNRVNITRLDETFLNFTEGIAAENLTLGTIPSARIPDLYLFNSGDTTTGDLITTANFNVSNGCVNFNTTWTVCGNSTNLVMKNSTGGIVFKINSTCSQLRGSDGSTIGAGSSC